MPLPALGMTWDERWGMAEFLEDVVKAISEPKKRIILNR